MLEFRAVSSHPTCTTCFRLKQDAKKIKATPLPNLRCVIPSSRRETCMLPSKHSFKVRNQEDFAERLAAIKAYRQHLAAQFQDRYMLWAMRGFAQDIACTFLLLVADGIDQAKWRLPRDPELRAVHALHKFQRPTCVVECVWCINHVVSWYVLDKDQAHDSNSVMSCVSLTLEKVARMYAAEGRDMPPNIVYWVCHPAFS